MGRADTAPHGRNDPTARRSVAVAAVHEDVVDLRRLKALTEPGLYDGETPGEVVAEGESAVVEQARQWPLLAGVQGVELLLPEGKLAVHVPPVRSSPFGPYVGLYLGFGPDKDRGFVPDGDGDPGFVPGRDGDPGL
ncbi:hypothetical protein QFZ30_003028 [Arthrobacter pascens]|uniref:hypothetical protein n=1 Tax=Arthrobacter pascens TaxID=1677 RepID=UPI002793C0EC|nr:hypothetical protein [Arthrobacter pascens]MDQ0679646.1 hypothetical protein [Arthrobacter pascens]